MRSEMAPKRHASRLANFFISCVSVKLKLIRDLKIESNLYSLNRLMLTLMPKKVLRKNCELGKRPSVVVPESGVLMKIKLVFMSRRIIQCLLEHIQSEFKKWNFDLKKTHKIFVFLFKDCSGPDSWNLFEELNRIKS